MPINSFLYPGAKTTPAYEVANSLTFSSSDDSLSKTYSSSGNTKTWTLSTWVKRSNIDTSQNQKIFGTNYTSLSEFMVILNNDGTDEDKINILNYTGGGGAIQANATTARVFRDPSAWFHLLVVLDTTQSSESDRLKVYINGSLATLSGTIPSQNADLVWNNSSHTLYIGEGGSQAVGNFQGYLCETVFVDGTALDQDSFGEFDEDSPTIWKPKDVSTLSLGTNGFYLDYEDSSDLGNDASGSNNWSVNQLAATDQSTDTCTNNFCTLNPLKNNTTLSEGNLKCVTGTGTSQVATSTFAPNAGKWYWEVKVDDATALMVGVADITATLANSDWAASGGYYYYNTGVTYNNNSSSSYGDSFTDGDIIGVALDLDNNKIYFSKNGTFQNSGDPTSGSSGTGAAFTLTGQYFPALSNGSSHNGATAQMNFGSPSFSISSGNTDANGHGNFEYSVPSGYFALCTKNLAEFG